jgi:hypothetical protein
LTQYFKHLGGVRGDPPGLVAGEELGRRAPTGRILEIDVGERLAGSVADDEALGCSSITPGDGKSRAALSGGLTSIEGKRGSRICFFFREPCHGRYPHK